MKKVLSNREKLNEALQKRGKINLSEAMDMLSISQSSVRRLFCLLEAQREAIRVHGGIVPISRPEYSYEAADNENMSAKEAIAKYAVALLSCDDVIYLDSGTTIAAMASALAARLEADRSFSVKVFTNSLVNLQLLSPVTRINLVGGTYRSNRKDVAGYVAEIAVRGLRFDKCFLGTDGYDSTLGFTATDFSTARLNEVVLAASGERIVLADSSKLTGTAVVSYTREHNVNLLVTNALLPDTLESELTAHGTRVHIVSNY